MFGQINLSVALTVAFVEVQGIEYSTPLACQSLAGRHCNLYYKSVSIINYGWVFWVSGQGGVENQKPLLVDTGKKL